MRLAAAAALGLVTGAVLACGELAALLSLSEFFSGRTLQVRSVEIFGLELRYGMSMAIGLVVLALLRPKWSLRRCAGVALGSGFFALCGWWIHRQLLLGIPFWEASSILATLGLIVLSIALGWLTVRVGRSRPLAGVLLLLALSLLSPIALALAYPRTQSISVDRLAPLAAENLPDITLIIIDTLRADRLSCYGNPRQTSPVIDRVASRGARFEMAMAQSSWTKPSMASLHSGTYPSSHRAIGEFDALPLAATTIAEMLQTRGYRTGAFSANPHISPTFAFNQGFGYFWNSQSRHRTVRYTVWGQFYRDFVPRNPGYSRLHWENAEVVTDKALNWLQEESRRPVFTYIHYIDPHWPYDPPEFLFEGERPAEPETRAAAGKLFPFGADVPIPEESRTAILDLYDAEIRYCDRAIGRLLNRLTTLGRLDETDYLIITSDHGEQFYEHHHWRHGRSLFSEEIRVPLILQGPGVPVGLVIRHPVSLIDLHPTIAEWGGAVSPTGLPAQSLQSLMDGIDPDAPRLVYSELLYTQKQFSLVVDTAKTIEVPDFERDNEPFFMTFDLTRNPREQVQVEPAHAGALLDRSDPSFAAATDLRELLAMVRDEAARLQIGGGGPVEVPEEILDQLRALGYLDN